MKEKREFYVGDELYIFVKYDLYAKVKVLKKRNPYGRNLYLIKLLEGIGEGEVLAQSLFTEKELK